MIYFTYTTKIELYVKKNILNEETLYPNNNNNNNNNHQEEL